MLILLESEGWIEAKKSLTGATQQMCSTSGQRYGCYTQRHLLLKLQRVALCEDQGRQANLQCIRRNSRRDSVFHQWSLQIAHTAGIPEAKTIQWIYFLQSRRFRIQVALRQNTPEMQTGIIHFKINSATATVITTHAKLRQCDSWDVTMRHVILRAVVRFSASVARK